jgi:hypothetical protein
MEDLTQLYEQVQDSLILIKHPLSSQIDDDFDYFKSIIGNLIEFSKLVSYLTKKLSVLCKIDENVNAIESNQFNNSISKL